MKTRNLMMAFVATAALLLGGCQKSIDLAGTQWEGTYTSVSSQQGQTYTFFTYYDMYFTDATNGYFDLRIDYAVDGGEPLEYGSGNLPFTWTFDGEKEGKIKAHLDATGQDIVDLFEYNDDGTITLYDGGATVHMQQVK